MLLQSEQRLVASWQIAHQCLLLVWLMLLAKVADLAHSRIFELSQFECGIAPLPLLVAIGNLHRLRREGGFPALSTSLISLLIRFTARTCALNRRGHSCRCAARHCRRDGAA